MSQKRAKKVKKRVRKAVSKKRMTSQPGQEIVFKPNGPLSQAIDLFRGGGGGRFSSINTEYNTMYDYSDELQLSSGMDEDGPLAVLSQLADLVEKDLLDEQKLTDFKALYAAYLAVWCIHVVADKPEDPAPYMDWWRKGDSLVSLGKNDSLKSLTILPEMEMATPEAMTIWVSKEILNDKSLHRDVDDMVFCDASYSEKYHAVDWIDKASAIRNTL